MDKKIIKTGDSNKQKERIASTIKAGNTKTSATVKTGFAFGKKNYYIMLLGLFVIILGFILMIGGGSNNPDVFNEKEIFSFRRITLAPILVLAGYVIEIFAILYKSKD